MNHVAPVTRLLDVAGVEAAPGRQWSKEWTRRVDAALTTLLNGFLAGSGPRSGGVALIALGSYARRALCPRSDIDLLILHDGWSGRDLEAIVRGVCYPLWDAGLSVGHAVRTSKEAVRAAGDRVDTATALTERRLVAGSAGLAEDLGARVSRWLRNNSNRLASEIGRADAERHRAYGGTAGALEPELKDGIGGLRDLHSLRWAGAILLGEAGLDPLVGARYLGASDRADLATAAEVLLSARCALHLVGDKGVRNKLRLDLQEEVADELRMADGDALLREVGLATRTIAHLHNRTWPVMRHDAKGGRRRRRPPPRVVGDGLVIADGLVEVEASAKLAADRSLALRACATAATHGTVVGRRSSMRLRREVAALGSLPWDARARVALLELLRAGPKGLTAMADADYLGVMAALLPEWERVRGRPQRNPLHTFDLDTHAMQASAWLARTIDGEFDERHTRLHEELENPDALVLGTWLHDVGKAWPGDHSVAGETVARDWVLHMGFDAATADRVARIVRLHLLLPDTATGRDIDDRDEVERVAVGVGDVETLTALYLLSYADSRATGRPAWSDWKDLLITKLYDSTRAMLEGDVGVLATPTAPDVIVRAAVREGLDEADVRATIDGLPQRYLRVASAEQIAAHARLRRMGNGGLLVDVRDGPTRSTQTLSIAGPDRLGLIADVVGALAARRVDVLEARVFSHDDGTSLAWFVVAAQDEVAWARLTPLLERAHGDQVVVAREVEKRERARDVKGPNLAEPVPISITTSPSGTATRVDVRGPDGPGVLYRLTHAFAGLGVSLLGARVATLGPEVRDAFFIRGDIPSDDVLEKALTPAFDPPVE